MHLALGGLDLVMVGGEVGITWHCKLKAVKRAVQQLFDVKKARDERILLALLTNAARSTLNDNVPKASLIKSSNRWFFCRLVVRY